MKHLLIAVGIDLYQGGLVTVRIADNHEDWWALMNDESKTFEITIMGGSGGEMAIVAWYCDNALRLAVGKAEVEDMVIDHINRVAREVGEFHCFVPSPEMIAELDNL